MITYPAATFGFGLGSFGGHGSQDAQTRFGDFLAQVAEADPVAPMPGTSWGRVQSGGGDDVSMDRDAKAHSRSSCDSKSASTAGADFRSRS